MLFSRRHTRKTPYAKKEFSASHFIPYLGHWDSTSVITKDEELVSVIKLEGFSFETADDEDLELKKIVRNTLLKSIATGNLALWFHVVRKKRKIELQGEFESPFCQELDNIWKQKHSNKESFVNELYLSIVYKKDTRGVGGIEQAFLTMLNRADKGIADDSLKKARDGLHEAVNRVMGSLKSYHPKLLGIREEAGGAFSEVMEFLGMLVNGGYHQPMRVPATDASHYLPSHRLYFGKNALEVKAPDGGSRFAGIVAVKRYANFTHPGMLDDFLRAPFECIISQSYVFINQGSAINSIQLQQRRMISAGDKAISQMEELTHAMDMTQSGEVSFGEHHFSVMAIEESLPALDKALSLCHGVLVNLGITPIREMFCFQATYWAQLPANFSYIARGSVINTLNMAAFSSLHNYPNGQNKKNHWGPAVSVFDTTSGTPYYFNFHVRDVGHTTVIGPTGSGKTVLLNFLAAQAQKFNCRMFFFDKDHGAEIFIRAIGGVYTDIEPGSSSIFNPLQMEDTPENRGFLEEWMRTMLLATQDQELTPEEREIITQAIEGNFKLPREQRQLSNIMPFLGIEGPGTLATRMKMWYGEEVRGGLFDNKEDQLDFSSARVFGFEMGDILVDRVSLTPTLLYLFHRIQMSLDGTPTIIVLDEAWALIDNEVFAPKIKDWLKVLRKLNAMVIFATQSVEDLSGSAISDTLVQQTATQIFLPNPKGTEEYKRNFMLSDREFALIKTTDPSSRYFLVKQGDGAVIARIDLSGMDDVIAVLSGRAETVALLEEIREEFGEDPDVWLPVFYRRVKSLEAKQS